jgi:hypothetical protein
VLVYYIQCVKKIIKVINVRVGTHKDYGHGRSELPSCDMSADVDEGTGTSSVQAPTKRLLGHY